MKYLKANEVLPEDILEILQQYIDGEYLYIPRKKDNEKSWGEKNGTRTLFIERNHEIYEKFSQGVKVPVLAKEYYLSEQSIRRILSSVKNELCG